MDAVTWKPVGPCDARPLDFLEHACVPGIAGTDGPFTRPGYSLAEASALTSGSPGLPTVKNSNTDKSLRLRLLQKKFALWGLRGEEELYRPIRRECWLEIVGAEIVEKSTGIHWRDVRFIPEIYAPNIHIYFDDLTLQEAFERVVLSDPETQSAFRAASRAAPCLFRVLSDRHLFGPDHLLKIEKMSFLAFACSRHLNSACAELAGKKIKLGAYPDLISRKSAVLLRRLSSGRILSDGFFRSDTRQRNPIDPALWARTEYAIDLRNGDLVNVETGETEWRSIVLRAPPIEISDEDEETRVSQHPRHYSEAQKMNGAAGGKKSGEARKRNRKWTPHARELAIGITEPEKRKNKATLAREIFDRWKLVKPSAPNTRTLEDFVDELIEEKALPPFDTK